MKRDEMNNGDERERECELVSTTFSMTLIPEGAYTGDSSEKGVKGLER